ncbi:Cathepsin_B [Hexamita inflata]|uniref:Cathepsin B n=1 Tax=Hexamita inflata TaxID=28002 RepID=A0AA86QZ20_9EUKA|nr:Cathepsin B [Hexamita inflata]
MFCLLLSKQTTSLQAHLEVLKNIPDLTWTPEIPKFLQNKSQAQVNMYFTPKQQSRQVPKFTPLNTNVSTPETHQDSVGFDWTVQRPECLNYVEPMEHCVQTELFASINMFSDIRCIKNLDKQRVQYSYQYQLSCYNDGNGCNQQLNDDVDFARHLEKPFGAVPASCVSYTSGKTGKVAKCPTKCNDGSNLPSRITMDDLDGMAWADWDNCEEMVQSMVREGPVQMGFNAYSDLVFYSGGVYTHSFGESLGEFRGEVVGWGTDNGVKFWKMKMSFGEDWGERGFLRIAQTELITRLWYFIM